MNKFKLKHFIIVSLFIQSFKMYSQSLPIIGFGDQANYRIDYFTVPGSSGLDLHWHGGIRFGDYTGNSVMQITNGKVGIGTTNPTVKLEVTGNIVNNVANGLLYHRTYRGSDIVTNLGSGSGDIGLNGILQLYDTPTVENIRLYASGNSWINGGNVGIGTTNADSKLTVKGKIHAEEVKIDLAVPADYVFEKYYLGKSSLKPDYNLPTLSEVEKYTRENHHLPNVPSAKEIKENGLLLGEMSNVLLQKIEELTLYSIDQQKTIEKQASAIEKLEERLVSIEKEVKTKKI